ncbi:cell division protein FtsQ/DivIB [Streptococcus halichoeri]|uniref:cell division protein FtsQ/DivIB n=1 Tax=Streptococcus halichoeri TaxID=254785 RepID=UPI0013571025|nr:cell division protein FtsQ/DivIB [Streptococcus halichoeri]
MTQEKHNKPNDQEPVVLTEWQKRNIEFLQKKKAKEADEYKLKEKLRIKKRQEIQTKPTSDDSSPADQASDSTDDSKTLSKSVKSSGKKAAKKTKSAKKAKATKIKPVKKQPRTRSKKELAFIKALPVLLISTLVLALSSYFVTPHSQAKRITITGNTHVSKAQLIQESGIKSSDYWIKLLFGRKHYEHNLISQDIWVKDAKIKYHFLNHFTFKIKEHRIIAYAQTQKGYQPILENGRRVAAISKDSLPKSYLIINLEDQQAIQELVRDLAKLPADLVKDIKSINSAKSKTTTDLLVLTMQDGNIIRLAQSQLPKRLPYYLKIKKNLKEPSIVDMEVGIYTTTQAIEAKAADDKSDSKKADEPKAPTNQAQEQTAPATSTTPANAQAAPAGTAAQVQGGDTASQEPPSGQGHE